MWWDDVTSIPFYLLNYKVTFKWLKNHVLKRYQNFFDVIAKDVSVSEDNLNLSDLFGKGFRGGTLNIKVRKENGGNAFQGKIFQEITFSSDGNYYRVTSPYQKDFFAYFYHPNVYDQAIVLLNVQ